jgi:hypothetical protein
MVHLLPLYTGRSASQRTRWVSLETFYQPSRRASMIFSPFVIPNVSSSFSSCDAGLLIKHSHLAVASGTIIIFDHCTFTCSYEAVRIWWFLCKVLTLGDEVGCAWCFNLNVSYYIQQVELIWVNIIVIWRTVWINGVIRKALGHWGRFYSYWLVPSAVLQFLSLQSFCLQNRYYPLISVMYVYGIRRSIKAGWRNHLASTIMVFPQRLRSRSSL